MSDSTTKVDIYALGSVFVELCHRFASTEDRIAKLSASPRNLVERGILTDEEVIDATHFNQS